jgi:hypothetical protein
MIAILSLSVGVAAACGTREGSGFPTNGGGSEVDGSGVDNQGDGATIDLTGGDGGSIVLSPNGDGGGGGDATIPPTVTSIDECSTGLPSGLTTASVQALMAGGSPGSLRYLYPYSGTVFPRGLISPTLMWDPAPADYVYVHIKSNAFEYKGCLAPTASGQVLVPQNVWEAASGHTSGASAPFSVSLTLISSGKVTGPITEPIVIAAATLSGSIYYNSYTTKLVSTGGGAVLRIVPGQAAQLFLGSSGCTACHAVSANGGRMVADPYNALNNGGGASYALTPNIGTNPAPLASNVPNGTFVGMYPDGTLYVGNAHPDDGLGGPRAGSPGYAGPVNAGLYETDTGNAIASSGIPTTVMTPSFSPDGTMLAFNDYAIANGGGLATMSFSVTSKTATNYKKVFQVSDSSTYPGWPFFFPDNGGLVFAIGNQADFSGGGLGLGLAGGIATATSDLYVLDVASGTSTILAQAMGFSGTANAASGTTYLPYGTTELHHNFYPTVSPVAAGGYFWVFFDSYRYYGNNGQQRQLWGTAVDVQASGKYTTDGSHPAFYVSGQELGTGNHRAFTALDPCHANGATCTSGYDCCGGFCTNGVCGLPTPRCSNTGETCTSGHTCCDASEQCINGFCSLVIQ